MLDKDKGCTDEPNEVGRVDLEYLKELEVQAYAERNRLVCALSKLLPSHILRHPDSDKDWDNDWRWIVCIHIPIEHDWDGHPHGTHQQVTWHIHDSELPMFNHIPYPAIKSYVKGREVGYEVFNRDYVSANGRYVWGYCNGWDGHTTEEKYKRLERISAKL